MILLTAAAPVPAPAIGFWTNLLSGGLGALFAGVLAAIGVRWTIKSQNSNLETTFEKQQELQRAEFKQQQALMREQFERQDLASRQERAVNVMDAVHDAALEVAAITDRPISTGPEPLIDAAARLMQALTKAVAHFSYIGIAPMEILKEAVARLDAAREACLPNQHGVRIPVHVRIFGDPARVVAIVASRWMIEREIPESWTYKSLAADLEKSPSTTIGPDVDVDIEYATGDVFVVRNNSAVPLTGVEISLDAGLLRLLDTSTRIEAGDGLQFMALSVMGGGVPTTVTIRCAESDAPIHRPLRS